MRTKWLTAIFAASLVLITLMANTGELRPYVRWLNGIPGADKIGHFVLMGTLSFLVNLTLRARRWRIGPIEVLAGSAIVIVFVTVEEFTQRFIPMRTASWFDLAADYLGILLLGWLAAAVVARGRRAERIVVCH